MVSISYCVTAWNEHEELDRLLTQLLKYKRQEDEVIVQVDITVTEEVRAVVSRHGLILYSHPLSNNFARFKNNIKSLASKDYYFLIDADEYLTETLILNLGEVLELNPDIPIFAVPRINTVEGLTQEHISKWRMERKRERMGLTIQIIKLEYVRTFHRFNGLERFTKD